MGIKTMNVNEFISEYGKHVRMYKEYENDCIMFKFDEKSKCMWLKGLVCEKLDMKVKTSSNTSSCYWFEPNN